MAVTPAEEVPFDEDGPDPVADLLAAQISTRAGWVNLSPEVEPEAALRPRGVWSTVFSNRGHAVPLVTVAAPEEAGQPITVGIEHGAGPRALDRLTEHQLPLPDGWRKLTDHPRRGLVLAVPADADVDALLWWVLAAAHALSAVPLTGSWLARVYHRP